MEEEGGSSTVHLQPATRLSGVCHPKWGLDDLVSCPTLGGTEEFTSCCL